MARHRAPRRQWFRKAAAEETALRNELNEFFEDELPTAAADQPIETVPVAPVTAPVARVVDLAERRIRPPKVHGADIVMMTRPATNSVEAVYPDGRVETVPCELRVVATLDEISDGMILNVTGGGRSAAIAVTHRP